MNELRGQNNRMLSSLCPLKHNINIYLLARDTHERDTYTVRDT